MLAIAANAAALAQDAKPTIIHAKIISTHDRLPPNPILDQVILEEFTFTLSGKNHVEEQHTFGPISDANHPSLNMLQKGNSRATLGEGGSMITWRVLGPHKLQRIAEGMQFIVIINIDINDARECRIDANYILQKGRKAIIARRIDNGELHEFSLNKVREATCWVD